jgi:hypothetical protein
MFMEVNNKKAITFSYLCHLWMVVCGFGMQTLVLPAAKNPQEETSGYDNV